MKLTTTLPLLALAASPISCFPWKPQYESPSKSYSHSERSYWQSQSTGQPSSSGGGSWQSPGATPACSGESVSTGGFTTAGSPSSTGRPTDGGNSTGSGTAATPKSTGVPAGCLKKNNIPVGWLPEAPQDFETITSNLGTPGCFFGQYSQITSQSYDGSQLNQVSVDQLQAFTEVTSNVASQVADVLKKFTDQNVEVYLRFAHEMNWYASSQAGTYHGSASEFVTAWKNIATAVADNEKISMFWSPNQASDAKSLINDGWWPGPDTVDVVGIDIYPKSHETFSDVYKDFHDTFAKAFNKPFVIAETGYSSSSDDDKKYWLEQLSSAEALSSCPNYAGFSWFEYNKEQNFYVASHGETLAKTVLE